MPRTATRKPIVNPEIEALRLRGRAMLAVFAAAFPVGSEVPAVGKGVIVERLNETTGTLRGPRGRDYSLTPCLKGTVIGAPGAMVFAAVCSAGPFRANAKTFALSAEGKVIPVV